MSKLAVPEILKKRLPLAACAVAAAALCVPAGASAAPLAGASRVLSGAPAKPAVLTFRTAEVGAPGNPAAAIVPFTDAIYRSCAEAPAAEGPRAPKCMEVGSVPYEYGIGQLEVTVEQWVAFLNTVDPEGTNRHKLYSETESGTEWPRFGQVDLTADAVPGHHYALAAPQWANKPYGFANFLRSARFANSVSNGKVLMSDSGQITAQGFHYVTYRVRLSRNTETGMYEMTTRAPVRTQKNGFVIPSQNEWIKAAYYEPKGGGTYSYWKYPTNAGVFGDGSATAPTQATLNPKNGNLTNAAGGPVATYHELETTPPSWCPPSQTPAACATQNPFKIPAAPYEKIYAGSLATVGQAGTLSPWGTLDQGGNAVEWTDTITAPPFGAKGHRVWRRLHGGIANAPVYQLWLSAVGLQPQDNAAFTATYPWLGLRIGAIGNPDRDH